MEIVLAVEAAQATSSGSSVQSTAFADNGPMPEKYAAYGEGIRRLSHAWSTPPAGFVRQHQSERQRLFKSRAMNELPGSHTA